MALYILLRNALRMERISKFADELYRDEKKLGWCRYESAVVTDPKIFVVVHRNCDRVTRSQALVVEEGPPSTFQDKGVVRGPCPIHKFPCPSSILVLVPHHHVHIGPVLFGRDVPLAQTSEALPLHQETRLLIGDIAVR